MERGLTIMSVPFSASFHLYSELFTLNLRDLSGASAVARRGGADCAGESVEPNLG